MLLDNNDAILRSRTQLLHHQPELAMLIQHHSHIWSPQRGIQVLFHFMADSYFYRFPQHIVIHTSDPVSYQDGNSCTIFRSNIQNLRWLFWIHCSATTEELLIFETKYIVFMQTFILKASFQLVKMFIKWKQVYTI